MFVRPPVFVAPVETEEAVDDAGAWQTVRNRRERPRDLAREEHPPERSRLPAPRPQRTARSATAAGSIRGQTGDEASSVLRSQARAIAEYRAGARDEERLLRFTCSLVGECGGDFKTIEALLRAIEDAGVPPNRIVHNAALTAHSREGDLADACGGGA